MGTARTRQISSCPWEGPGALATGQGTAQGPQVAPSPRQRSGQGEPCGSCSERERRFQFRHSATAGQSTTAAQGPSGCATGTEASLAELASCGALGSPAAGCTGPHANVGPAEGGASGLCQRAPGSPARCRPQTDCQAATQVSDSTKPGSQELGELRKARSLFVAEWLAICDNWPSCFRNKQSKRTRPCTRWLSRRSAGCLCYSLLPGLCKDSRARALARPSLWMPPPPARRIWQWMRQRQRMPAVKWRWSTAISRRRL